jgi:hypothetical protein
MLLPLQFYFYYPQFPSLIGLASLMLGVLIAVYGYLCDILSGMMLGLFAVAIYFFLFALVIILHPSLDELTPANFLIYGGYLVGALIAVIKIFLAGRVMGKMAQ